MVCCVLVLDSVTSTPQWIRQPRPRVYLKKGTYHTRLFRGPSTNDMKRRVVLATGPTPPRFDPRMKRRTSSPLRNRIFQREREKERAILPPSLTHHLTFSLPPSLSLSFNLLSLTSRSLSQTQTFTHYLQFTTTLRTRFPLCYTQDKVQGLGFKV